jgi:hypothetical protein
MKERLRNAEVGALTGPSQWTATLLKLLIYESYFAKSAAARFLPAATAVAIHYVSSILLISGILLIQVILRPKRTKMSDRSLLGVGGLIIGWLFISALNQGEAGENCLAVALVAAIAYLGTVALPTLLGWSYGPTLYGALLSSSRAITALSFLALIVPVVSAFDGGRFEGVTLDPAVAAGAFFIATCLFFVNWIRSRRVAGAFIWFVAAAILTVLTRSRGAIGTTAVTCVLILLLDKTTRGRSRRVVGALVVIVTAVSALVFWSRASEGQRGTTLEFLRLDSGDLLDSREPHWQAGLERIESAKVFGLGILLKFTSKGSVQDQMRTGNTGYDVSMDPHNSLLNIGQAAGYPAAALLAVFLGLLFIKSSRLALLTGTGFSAGTIFCVWLVLADCATSFASPMFLSFGSLDDRIFYLCLGVVLASSSKARMLSAIRKTTYAAAVPAPL